jgi:trimethylamine-N-oxide reductase (cytochrome c) cytochrome c-type subunit TorY
VITAQIDADVLDSLEPIWDYAEELDNVYCATCHAKIPAGHFTVNAWGPVAKGMGDRTDISAEDLELLTKFFQNHAKDVAGH